MSASPDSPEGPRSVPGWVRWSAVANWLRLVLDLIAAGHHGWL